MACCNPNRVRIGLHCELGQQLACWEGRLSWLAEYRQEEVPQQIEDGLQQFPEYLTFIRLGAKRIDRLDLFMQLAAIRCASLPTKTDRRNFREQLVPLSTDVELQLFDSQMAAEWARLRGKANPTK